jgi:hypothetical protein
LDIAHLKQLYAEHKANASQSTESKQSIESTEQKLQTITQLEKSAGKLVNLAKYKILKESPQDSQPKPLPLSKGMFPLSDGKQAVNESGQPSKHEGELRPGLFLRKK